MRGAPHSGLSALIPRISGRSSAPICGRPPRNRDFHRQYRRKPDRCQRTRVSGRMIVMALRTDGNHRYSWTRNKRSPFVSWTRPRTLRRSTISWCRSAAFSASSRLFDLNGETDRVRKSQKSAIIAVDVRRFGHAINTDQVFGTHNQISVGPVLRIEERIAADRDLGIGLSDLAELHADIALARIRAHGFREHASAVLELGRHLIEHRLHER